MRMLDLLHDAIHRLPRLLTEHRNEWESVNVTYHRPHVERLWMQLGECRLFLHRIHPCDDGHALFHPHPWPSAVRIVSGDYEHKIGTTGYAEGNHDLPVSLVLSRAILVGGAEYEMVNRDAWHSVRPVVGPSDSIMITGPLHQPRVEMPNLPKKKQDALSPERFDELFAVWQARFPA